MKLADAQNLLSKYVKGETLLRHSKTVSVVMRYFAEKLNMPNPEFWESVGLLHDIDYEMYPDEHCIKCKEIFEKERANYEGLTDELVHAVQSHGWKLCADVEPESPMEKVLYTIDELTGLIFATAMARPSKSVMDMEVKSVTKKFKALTFAAACNREVIKEGASMMGMELNEVIEGCILAMRTEHEACGC